MNILLVNNIASLHSNLAIALNKIEGIEAKYIVEGKHKYINSNEYEIAIERFPSRRNLLKHIHFKTKIKRWIKWADIIYYMMNSMFEDFDLEYAYSLKKKIFIEWVGSDIRNPEILFKINPYYKAIFYNGYNYKDLELSNFKNEVQARFSKYNAKVLTTPEMHLYIKKEMFPNIFFVFQRINIEQFTPAYPSEVNKMPLIIHSPSAPIAKGSNIILPVIEELKKEYLFEFKLLTDMPRIEVLNYMQKADVFLDQIVIGGYGLASVEALSFGKPVMCYLMPELLENGLPMDCPIVNTNPDNLKSQLIRLITDGNLRNELGKRSRAYAEKYHDATKIGHKLVEIFDKN